MTDASTTPAPRRRHLLALLTFPVGTALLVLVVLAGIEAQSAVRAYVGGESAWSRAQKGAVQALYRYAVSGDERDWGRYATLLEVPRSDERARLEMERDDTRADVVSREFIRAHNHPDDVTGMRLLFEWFGEIGHMRRAAAAWRAGDVALRALDGEALALRARVRAGERGTPAVKESVARIRAIDDRLTVLEAHFSDTLGEGARWVNQVVASITVALALLLTVIGTAVVARMFRHEAAAAAATRRHDAQFRTLVEGAPDVIARYDRQHRLAYVNRAASVATGLPVGAMVGRTLAEIGMTAEMARRWDEALDRCFTSGGEQVVESEVARPDGTRVFDARLVAERGADGVVESVLSIGRDVTDLRASEHALRDSEDQLRQAQKLEAVGRLAGGVAHDFNNLLTVIGANVDLLRADAAATPAASAEGTAGEATELLDEIRQAVDRAAGLTRQLLAVSRRQVLRPRVVALNETVRAMSAMLARLIGEDITLVNDLAPTLHPVRIAAGQVEQVLLNLAVNARDAMGEGGRLDVRTRNVRLPAGVTAGSIGRTGGWVEDPEGGHVLLEVRDSGTGIDAVTRERMFEPFFTTKGPGKGTGLGLATVHGIVAQADGMLEVESRPGAGATFRIFLPCASAEQGHPTPLPPARATGRAAPGRGAA